MNFQKRYHKSKKKVKVKSTITTINIIIYERKRLISLESLITIHSFQALPNTKTENYYNKKKDIKLILLTFLAIRSFFS